MDPLGAGDVTQESDILIDNVASCEDGLRKQSTKKSYYRCEDPKYPLCSMTLSEIYERQAKINNGNGVTFYRPAERLTYTEIYEKGMAIAKGLISHGLKRGDTVLCFGCQGSDGLLMFVATSSIGLKFATPYLYAPVPKTMEMFLHRLQPKVVLIGNSPIGFEQREIVFPHAMEAFKSMKASDPNYNPPFTYYDSLTETDERYPVSANEDVRPLSDLMKRGRDVTDDELRAYKSLVGHNEPCLFSCSSGSTGEPKLVVIGSELFTNGGMRREERFGSTVDSRCACPNMASEEIAVVEEFTCGVYTGREVIILPQYQTWDCVTVCSEILECIQQLRPEIVYADQYFASYIINHMEMCDNYDLSSLKSWILGGSGSSKTFKLKMLERWPQSVDAFGMTENYYSVAPYLGQNKEKVHVIGKPVVNLEAKIVDVMGETVNCGERGELWLRGYGNFLEYKDQPELTRKMLTEDGWLKSGDCAVMDEDGDIQIIGRMTDSERFKVNGDVIYAQVIERVMKENPLILSIAVVGRHTGSTYGHELSYCIIPSKPGALTINEVFLFAKEKLRISNEWPMRVFFYEKFPLQGARNKVSRKALLDDIKKRVEQDFSDSLCEQTYDL